METRKNTTAGVLFWTPAPVRTSPTSSVISEEVWEEEEVEEEQAEKDDDFVSQMDENGIIGLSEALQDVESGEHSGDAGSDCNSNSYPGPFPLEEADLSGHERVASPEELSSNRSEHLRHGSQQLAPPGDDRMTVGEEVRHKDTAQGEGECAGQRTKSEHMSTSREPGTKSGLASKRELEISCEWSGDAHLPPPEPAAVSSHHCPISQHAPPVTADAFPYLLHFTAEELAAARGIEAETFPEISFTESLPESHGSRLSLKSNGRSPEVKLRAPLQPAAMFLEESEKRHKQRIPSPRKTRQRSPEAACSSTRSPSTVRAKFPSQPHPTSPGREPRLPRAGGKAKVNDSRKGPLSYPTPDFSKVEPRVRLPKGGYNPPKSRRSSKRESLSPEPPLVFKSPADIVKEVLLNASDERPALSDSPRPRSSVPSATVPAEFRCRQQATTLLEQLQEDYNRLLTKYAEAENTIDRLRLEAKVNMHCNLPKPGHLVHGGLNQQASKMVTLDFCQAQRAEMNSASPHPEAHSAHQGSPSACPWTTSPGPPVGQQLARILYGQADKFLQQLQTFEEILKSQRLSPFEQMKGATQLAEGLDALERGYLLARDEHKVLQQRGAELSPFDPERELEGLIFQCGLRMDEVKEQAELTQQEQPVGEVPPSHPTPSRVPSDGGETLSPPQSPPEPLLVDPGEAVAAEASSASEGSDGEEAETEEEEALNSQYLRRVERDFGNVMEQRLVIYQSFRELRKLSDHSQKGGAAFSVAPGPAAQPEDGQKETWSGGSGNLEVQRSVPESKSDRKDSLVVGADRSSPPSRRASSRSTTPSHPASSGRRFEVQKSRSSSASSLGEMVALETRTSKLEAGISRVLSQDGIISPETDSGFVGSESSRVSGAAAAPSPVQQRASESSSVAQERNPGRPHTPQVSAPSPSHSCRAAEPRGGPRLRRGQRRRTLSCSPQHWVSGKQQSRGDSGSSEFGLESDGTHTVSEDGQNDPYARSIHSPHSSSPSCSPAVQYHHGDRSRTLSHGALQALQAEVSRLRERVESCVRNRKPVRSVRAAQESHTPPHSGTPGVRSAEQQRDVSRGKRDGRPVDEVEESMLRRTTRRRAPSASRQQPQLDGSSSPEPPSTLPLVSTCTQTSCAAPHSCCSRTSTVHSRAHPRQHPADPAHADEPDRSRPAPLCPLCLSRRPAQPEGPLRCNGQTEPRSSRCRHRPLCGCPRPDCCRVSDATSHQPARSPDTPLTDTCCTAAAPPALLQCMPLCPPPLLLYPSLLYTSPCNSSGTSVGVRGHDERRGGMRRALSADKWRSVDGSLNRAVAAARHMRRTSGHMARSLAAGLHYQELLTQSCSY